MSITLWVGIGQAFLGEALESVFTQVYYDSEIVVINDGSTDHIGNARKCDVFSKLAAVLVPLFISACEFRLNFTVM